MRTGAKMLDSLAMHTESYLDASSDTENTQDSSRSAQGMGLAAEPLTNRRAEPD